MRRPWACPSPTSPAPAAAASCSPAFRFALADGAVLVAARPERRRQVDAAAGARRAAARRPAGSRSTAPPLDADRRAPSRRLCRPSRRGQAAADRRGEPRASGPALLGGDAGRRPRRLRPRPHRRPPGAAAARPASAAASALARLLLAPRRLWLLDEPTAALDADGEARLDALLAAPTAPPAASRWSRPTRRSPAATRDAACWRRPIRAGSADPFLAAGGWA